MFCNDLLSFSLSLNNPSRIAELQELEHWKTKFDTAGGATEGYFSRRWVAEHMFGMSHEDFIRNQREMYYDRIHDANLQQVAEAAAAEGAAAAAPAGEMGGDMGGTELGGEMGGPEEMPAAEAGAPEAGAPEVGGEEESALLAVPPGSRDAPRLTPGAKGKVYHPVNVDKRPAGARSRSYASKYSREKGSNTIRNILPGYGDLKSLVKMDGIGTGIYEEDQSIYSLREQTEEEQLFTVTASVRTLLKELESKDLITEQKNEDKTQQET